MKDMEGADFGITVESDSDESTSMPAAASAGECAVCICVGGKG